MTQSTDPIARLQHVARRLDHLCESVVFVGGAVTSLLITDRGASLPRPTLDVDAIVEVQSRYEYTHELRASLYGLGFREDSEDGSPLCRWKIDETTVDIMPIDPSILGFSNRWYREAMATALLYRFHLGPTIRMIAAPVFVATKLEAFNSRGAKDYLASHDLEDVISVIDGRREFESELEHASESLRSFVTETFRFLLSQPDFLNALPGHLPSDLNPRRRCDRLLQRIRSIS